VLVIALFCIFIWYGVKVALCSSCDFGSYLGFGIILVVGLQAAANIAVVTASVPTKGIGLPFVSYGGSSLVIFCGMTGVLLNIARKAMAPEVHA
jgi:cell division protein FtsW